MQVNKLEIGEGEIEAVEANLLSFLQSHIPSVTEDVDVFLILAILSGRALRHAANSEVAPLTVLNTMHQQLYQMGYEEVDCLCEECVRERKREARKKEAQETKAKKDADSFLEKFKPGSK